MHKRQQILQALRLQLINTANFTGVWIQRAAPQRITYPSITLFALPEETETETIHPHPRPQLRKLTVQINGWIRKTPDPEKIEADLDAAALLIEQSVHLEQLLISNPFLIDDLVLVSTDFSETDGDEIVPYVSLLYDIYYQSVENNPT